PRASTRPAILPSSSSGPCSTARRCRCRPTAAPTVSRSACRWSPAATTTTACSPARAGSWTSSAPRSFRYWAPSQRHARACSQACAGCINLPARASTSFLTATKTWMAGTSPAMTWTGLRQFLPHELHATLDQDIAQLLLEFAEERDGVLGVQERVVELVVVQEFLPAGRTRSLAQELFVVGNGVGRHARWADDAARLRHVRHFKAGFRQRRNGLEAGESFVGDLHQRAQLAGADELTRFRRLNQDEIDVPAEQRREPFTSGRERDEAPARPGMRHQELAHQRVARQHRTARLLDLSRVLERRVDHIAQCLVPRIGAHHDHGGLDHQPRDRRHVDELGRRLLLYQRIGDPDAGEDGPYVRVAFLVDHVGRRGGAAAADLVHDLQTHRRELLLVDDLDQGAAEDVGPRSRSVVNDDLDRPGRLELGGSRINASGSETRCRGENDYTLHSRSSDYDWYALVRRTVRRVRGRRLALRAATPPRQPAARALRR